MCDYSLMGIRSRLAVEGEQLVTPVLNRFCGARALGKRMEQIRMAVQTGFWATLWKIIRGPVGDSVPAVCVPPGARLLLIGVQRGIGARSTIVSYELPNRSQSLLREKAPWLVFVQNPRGQGRSGCRLRRSDASGCLPQIENGAIR
jgi:hypothetical protein